MAKKQISKFDFLESLSSEELKNLSKFILESIKIKSEIKRNQEILKDYIKAYAEENEYDKSVISKLVNLNFKIINDSDYELIEREMKILNILSLLQNKDQ